MKDSDGRRIKLSVSGGVRKPAVRDRQRRLNGGEPPSRTQPPNLTQSGLAQTNLTQSSLTTSSLAQHIQLSSARPQVRKIILFGFFLRIPRILLADFSHSFIAHFPFRWVSWSCLVFNSSWALEQLAAAALPLLTYLTYSSFLLPDPLIFNLDPDPLTCNSLMVPDPPIFNRLMEVLIFNNSLVLVHFNSCWDPEHWRTRSYRN